MKTLCWNTTSTFKWRRKNLYKTIFPYSNSWLFRKCSQFKSFRFLPEQSNTWNVWTGRHGKSCRICVRYFKTWPLLLSGKEKALSQKSIFLHTIRMRIEEGKQKIILKYKCLVESRYWYIWPKECTWINCFWKHITHLSRYRISMVKC